MKGPTFKERGPSSMGDGREKRGQKGEGITPKVNASRIYRAVEQFCVF